MNKLCRIVLLLTLLACLFMPAGASAVTGAQIAALRGERSYPQALDLPDALSVAAQSGGVMLRSAENGYPQPDVGKISELAGRYSGEIRDIGDAVDFLSVFTTDYVGALVHQANHLQSMYLQCEKQLSESDRTKAAQIIKDYSLLASQLYSEVEFLTKGQIPLFFPFLNRGSGCRVHGQEFLKSYFLSYIQVMRRCPSCQFPLPFRHGDFL